MVSWQGPELEAGQADAQSAGHRDFKTAYLRKLCALVYVSAQKKYPLNPTCDPKPYKTVGYDPLIRGSNP